MPTQSPSQQMSAADAAAYAKAMQDKTNREFMALAVTKQVLCQQANGGANNQAFSAGQPLTYNITTGNNAFLTGIWVRAALTVNCAAGTGAAYALNAAAPLSLIDSIQVLYGGNVHNFRPYILKYLSQFKSAGAQVQPRSIVAGQTVSNLQSYYASTSFPVATGNNTWNFAFYLPMNLLHPQDPRGILPIQNGQTSCQVILNCQGSPLGPDPVNNTIATTAGTGAAVTVTGNLSVIALYKDGMSFTQLTALQPNLAGLETVQIQRDTNLNNLGAGQVYRNKVGFLKKIPWLFATVIDGNQSNKFTQITNFQILETTADATGNRPFYRYGSLTNLDVRAFYDELSGKMGGLLQQDFDEGFLPLVWGPIAEQAEAGIYEGKAYLDCSQGTGWTDFHYGVQLGSVGGVAGINPRVEVTAIMLNDPLVM